MLHFTPRTTRIDMLLCDLRIASHCYHHSFAFLDVALELALENFRMLTTGFDLKNLSPSVSSAFILFTKRILSVIVFTMTFWSIA